MSLLSQIKEDIAVVFDRDPAARSRFEVVTTYPGFHAILIHRLAHGLWRRSNPVPLRHGARQIVCCTTPASANPNRKRKAIN